ncbi:MAG TPA: histidine--tRNA ligase [Solirubrobacteraceae bacterium]|nr:histidine--tRNA ligase [Solirubrobacteraceae bacterium]
MIEAPKGTYDVLPSEAARRELLEHHARKLLGAAGYRRIETPVFEATELFSRGVGHATDIVQKEMYTFTDAGGRSLTLRPEGTASICRAYIEHGMHKLAAPLKFWYLSPFFRAENVQRGRQRQFWQVGAEVIGAASPQTDAELIILLAELLEAMSVTGTRLRLGSLGTPETRAEYRVELTAYLRAREAELPAEVVARIDLNPMRAFDSAAAATVMADAPRLMDRLTPEDAEHFATVRQLLDGAGLSYELDTTLVRGLDYYTRTLFEFTSDHLGAQSGVGGGGRYDGLIEQLGGQPTAGAGWAAGVERILLAGSELPVAPDTVDLYVVAVPGSGTDAVAFTLAREARRAELHAQLELTGRSLKASLKHADRLGARWVALLGDGVALKDMESGEQRDLGSAHDVIPTILRGHRL